MNLKPAKKKAWTAFSLYIRTRDALKTTGTKETAKCVTCDRIYPIRAVGGLQAGHFLPNRHNSVLFNEKNCHAQCYGCNVMKKGNMVKYYKYMLENYGQKTIDELEELDGKVVSMKEYMFKEIADLYKKKLKEL